MLTAVLFDFQMLLRQSAKNKYANLFMSSIVLNPIHFNDLPIVERLKPDNWGVIFPDFEYYLKQPFCFPRKLVLKGEICGVGAIISFQKTAWLAHIIVGKRHRGKGLGTQLTAALVKEAQQMGHSTISLIATELGLPVYSKLGFQIEDEYLFFQRKSEIFSSPKSFLIHAFQSEMERDVLQLDEAITQENRSMVLKEHLTAAKVVLQNGQLTGFYLPTLKNGPICASNSTAGLALLNWKHQTIPKAALPSSNNIAVQFFERNGFESFPKRGARMWLGKQLEWSPGGIFSRIGGNMG